MSAYRSCLVVDKSRVNIQIQSKIDQNQPDAKYVQSQIIFFWMQQKPHQPITFCKLYFI